MKRLLLGIISLLFLGIQSMNGQERTEGVLWYNDPAQKWTEALPVGNGSLGAMVFGGVNEERIQLNEETIWTGQPIERANPEARAYLDSVRSLLFDGEYAKAEKLAQQKIMGKRLPTGTHTYQTLGNLHLEFADSPTWSNYRRSLDLDKALARVSYEKDDVSYERELFSSHPDNVIAMKIAANQAESLSFKLSLNRPGVNESVEVNPNELIMREHVGNGNGVRFTARVKVHTYGGRLVAVDSTLKVSGADSITILLAAASNYRGDDPDKVTQTRIEEASEMSYATLRNRHINDYQRLFERASLDLTPNSISEIATDKRIQNVQDGSVDPYLTELYFQYGRYLLVSSSRPGSLPANLQGLWAQGMKPPWNADYHTNINLQMNYWPAEVTNLSETADPLFDFTEALNERGRKTARQTYGAQGVVAHHTTDAWRFTDPIGQTYYGLWPMGAAWLSMHFWEHYKFTNDEKFLRKRAYPQMKAAAMFFADYLVEVPRTGNLVTGPSMSPENQFITPSGEKASVTMGPTMDMQIVNELFSATITAAKILDIDKAFSDTLVAMKVNLAPVQVGSDGTIMEWRKDFKEASPGHRHISHLYSLYPGNAINAIDNPALFEAARKTIDRRLEHGGGHTGWSRAWIINFFARLKDGEKAHQNLLALYRKSTLPNLFDVHPPFQIDGNFGGTAGIAEMLLQSHAGTIEFLPALPKAWADGQIKGLKARGNVIVDILWVGGDLQEAVLKASETGYYKLQYRGKKITLKLKTNKARTVKAELFE